MGTLATLLMSLVGPMVIKGLIALSFTAITFAGVTELTSQLIAMAVASWASMPAAVLQLVALAGIPEALGMVFGALSARVAMWAAVGASRYVFSPK